MAQPSAPPSSANGTTRASPGLAPNNSAAGTKRKRTTDRKYYAVREGKKPGIYDTWNDCLLQVRGHKGALFKAFQSFDEAQAFVEGKPLSTANVNPGEQKYYAVQNGRIPGVYTDWRSAQAQIRGIRGPKHKKFSSRAEAEAFVAAGRKQLGLETPENDVAEEEIRRLIVRSSAPGLQTTGTYSPRDKDGNPYPPGQGPLPPGAEDGFDPNLKLENGSIVPRTEQERTRTKVVTQEPSPPGMLRIYTDGSSLNNGQIGARAGVGVYFGPSDPKYVNSTPSSSSTSPPAATQNLYTMDWALRNPESVTRKKKLTNWRYRNVSEALKGSKQTNQRAELTAILRALDVAPRHRDVTIYTDSRYAIDCVTNWYKGWESNGWVNSRGKPVENRDLVQDVRERMVERKELGKSTYFVWVKGHAGDIGNIQADRLANEGARKGIHESIEGSIDESETLGSEDRSDDERDGSRDAEDSDDDDGLEGESEEVKESFRLMKEGARLNGED